MIQYDLPYFSKESLPSPKPDLKCLISRKILGSVRQTIETAQTTICDAVAQVEHQSVSEIIVTRIQTLSMEYLRYFPPTSFHSSDTSVSRMHHSRAYYDSRTGMFRLF